MNYYEHHIGDYAAATAHLSLVEDAVYSRLLRRYYLQEGPLPTDLRQVARLAGARSPEELEAVEIILTEFFTLGEDGWHNKRADEEIERYQAKQAKARSSANARWSKTAKPTDCGRNANAMRTQCEGNAHQTPDTSNTPDTSLHAPEMAKGASDAGRACLLMRQAGCSTTNPSHPDLLAALAEGVTPEALADTVREGLSRSPPVARPFAWAIATARSRNAEGPATTVIPIHGARHAAPVRRTESAVDRVHRNAQRMLEREHAPGIIEGSFHALGADG